MKNKLSKTKISFEIFEEISEIEGNKLLGGFSSSIGGTETIAPEEGGETNNCMGGNCKAGCGGAQNVNCNTVASCKG